MVESGCLVGNQANSCQHYRGLCWLHQPAVLLPLHISLPRAETVLSKLLPVLLNYLSLIQWVKGIFTLSPFLSEL